MTEEQERELGIRGVNFYDRNSRLARGAAYSLALDKLKEEFGVVASGGRADHVGDVATKSPASNQSRLATTPNSETIAYVAAAVKRLSEAV